MKAEEQLRSIRLRLHLTELTQNVVNKFGKDIEQYANQRVIEELEKLMKDNEQKVIVGDTRKDTVQVVVVPMRKIIKQIEELKQ